MRDPAVLDLAALAGDVIPPRRRVPAADLVLPVLDLDPGSRVVGGASAARAVSAQMISAPVISAPVISAGDLVGARPAPRPRLAPIVSPAPPLQGPPETPPLWARRLRAVAADSRLRIAMLVAVLIVLAIQVLGPRVLPQMTRDAIEAPFPPPGHAIAFVVPQAS
ncbi:MAG: hypothetical protein ACFE0R_12005 [Salinarimonas sp.]